MIPISFSGNSREEVDQLTAQWPVKPSLRDALDQIKYNFEACPLAVYVNDRFIQPLDVQAILTGALVEVQFELRHFSIAKKKEDSYNATIKQVLILQPGVERPSNAFKRRNLLDGPVRLNPTVVSAKEAEQAGSPFAKTCFSSGQSSTASASLAGPSASGSVTLRVDENAVSREDAPPANEDPGSSSASVTTRSDHSGHGDGVERTEDDSD